jgi:serine/threonine-protein kinase
MEPGSIINGKYRVVDVLAHGGMGKIYRAEQMNLGRFVALKILRTRFADEIAEDPQFQKRFLLEANILSRLEHANIVRLYDYGRIDDHEGEQYFMAMELLQGDTLTRRLRDRGALPVLDVVRLVRQLARGLGAAHKLDVVHRDLKPSNVILVRDEDGESARILDFGISKIISSGVADLTTEGTFLGSPRYMAPEQVSDGRVDVRTDVYSLGVIMYECLTGKVPFDGETNVGIMMAHCNNPIPPMRERSPGVIVPDALEALAAHSLQKSAGSRPSTMEDFLRELGACEAALSSGQHAVVAWSALADTLPDVAPPSVPTSTNRSLSRSNTPTVPPARRRTRLVAVAIAVVLVAVGGAAIVVRTRTDTRASAATSTPSATQRASFTLTIESSPASAEVREGDAVLGTTPLRLAIEPPPQRRGSVVCGI